MTFRNFSAALIFVIITFNCNSQSTFPIHFGGQISAVIQLGTHQRSLGVEVNGFAQYQFIQINGSSCFQFFNLGLGKRRNFFENRTAIGLVGYFGPENQTLDWQFNYSTKQAKNDYALSYASIWYFDNRKTSQRSGAFGLQVKKMYFYHENDAFAGIAIDRFRTGDLLIQWSDSLVKIGAGLQIWTGETTGVPKQFKPEIYPRAFKDVSSLPYGKTSHGIIYTQFQYRSLFNQTLSCKMGIDSEQVRHVFQNKLFHDLPFLPKKYQNQTPHYPRLNTEGLPVFTKNEVRKDKFYFSLGMK
jgi:hypothetical protein